MDTDLGRPGRKERQIDSFEGPRIVDDGSVAHPAIGLQGGRHVYVGALAVAGGNGRERGAIVQATRVTLHTTWAGRYILDLSSFFFFFFSFSFCERIHKKYMTLVHTYP